MNLGYCYLHGHGVPQDRAEALRLFRLAVEQGEDRAAQEVERIEDSRASSHVRIVDVTDPGKPEGWTAVDGANSPESPGPCEERS